MTAAAVVAPAKRPFTVGKPDKILDINHFHSSGHVNERLLMEVAQQHGVALRGVLRPCGRSLEAKGVRGEVPRRTTSRAERPMEAVHIDLAGPYEASMGGSLNLLTFVDSASKWMRPYGMKRNSETTASVQKFVADMNAMGRPHCVRPDNGGEFNSGSYVDYCDFVGIRRENTAPGKPQQTAVVESATLRAMKGDHSARHEIRSLFPGADFIGIPKIDASSLWLEAVLWAADCFNRSATKASIGWWSPHNMFYRRLPDLQVVPFFHEGMMRVDRGP